MFSTVKGKYENTIDIYDVGTVLKKTIIELKRKFESIWRNYKDVCEYIKVFHEKTIKEFINKFDDYKCPIEIERDFSETINHWEKNKEKLDNEVYVSYRILLFIYQMYFLEAFIRRMTMMNRQFLELNTHDEKKINIENIVQDILKHYQKKLEGHIFNNLDERLKHALKPDLSLLKNQINTFNQMPAENYYPTDFQNNNLLNQEKLSILISEELNQLRYRKKCKERQDLLNQKKTQIIQSNMHYLTELIDTVRTKKKTYPELDLLQNAEYKLIYHQYVTVNHYIQLFKLAMDRLKIILNDYKIEVEKYKKNVGYLTKWFGYDMSGIFEDCQKFIEKSRFLKTNQHNVPLEIDRFLKILPQLKENNDNLEKKLSMRFLEILSDEEKEKYYEEAILRKRKELLLYLTNIPEIVAPKNNLFENKKLELKIAWRGWFALPENRKNLEMYLKMKRKEIEEEKYSGEQKNEIMRLVFVLAKKLKKFEKDAMVISTDLKHDEQKNNKYSNSIIVRVSPSKYDFLINKPWKRILISSLISIAVIALCFSIWGLVAGLTFSALVLMMGGAGIFSSIVTGTFSLSLLSTLSLEYRSKCFCIPDSNVRDNNLSYKPSTTSYIDMPMTKSNMPFFSRKGEKISGEHIQVVENSVKSNPR